MGDLPVAALIDHRCVFGMRAGPEGLPDTSKLSYRSGIGDGKGIFQVSGTRNIELDTLRRNPRLRAMEVVAESGKTGPLYVVGGYLRDLLLGRIRARRADLDVVIWGEPERFGRDLVTAVKGSLVRLDPETVRVITQSAEGIVQIDISRPKGETIEDDLAARDFTVNALAVRLDTLDALSLIDPTGGLDDLRKKCLRVITPSAFDCDPLRLIRQSVWQPSSASLSMRPPDGGSSSAHHFSGQWPGNVCVTSCSGFLIRFPLRLGSSSSIPCNF